MAQQSLIGSIISNVYTPQEGWKAGGVLGALGGLLFGLFALNGQGWLGVIGSALAVIAGAWAGNKLGGVISNGFSGGGSPKREYVSNEPRRLRSLGPDASPDMTQAGTAYVEFPNADAAMRWIDRRLTQENDPNAQFGLQAIKYAAPALYAQGKKLATLNDGIVPLKEEVASPFVKIYKNAYAAARDAGEGLPPSPEATNKPAPVPHLRRGDRLVDNEEAAASVTELTRIDDSQSAQLSPPPASVRAPGPKEPSPPRRTG